MDSYEKGIWVFILWFTSLGTAFWLAGSIYTGWDWQVAKSPMIMFTAVFVASFIAWLFRVTYVSGRNS